jgi:RND family efflux transporter MFP subunit
MLKHKNKIIIGLILIVIVTVAFFGSKIPAINKIPIFAKEHEHSYRPVLDEKGDIEYWTCTMHPSVRLKDPGTCPICSMDLVAVKTRGTGDSMSKQIEKSAMKMDGDMQGTEDMKDMDHMHGMGGAGSGRKSMNARSESIFSVSPEKQQRIGVKSEPVVRRQMTKKIRTVGMVELDETKIEHIHTKFSGWIDTVYADYTFQHVKKGDPLFSIYSPEIVSTQQEYLLAIKSKDIFAESEFPEISRGAISLAESTKRRLKLWDISEDQIRELENKGKVKKNIIFHSPITGHVMFKNAFENMYVEPNTRIYTIADHTTAWINADIYESDISLVKPGQLAEITVESLPDETFKSKVTFTWPHLMEKTRTTKARLVFDNPDLKLLPGMYANVNIDIPMKDTLSIPESAVLKTGKQDVVFVDKGDGYMEIRKVELGYEADGFYEVRRGLSKGDRVVSRANFLIDAESKIQAAVATWGESSADDSIMKSEESKASKELKRYPQEPAEDKVDLHKHH